MKKSVLFSTTAVTVGLATVLTMGAISPASAKGEGSGKGSDSSFSATATTGTAKVEDSGSSSKLSAAVDFSVTGVPANYTSVQDLASQLVFKIVALPADATTAPATAPASTGKSSGKGKSDNKGSGKDLSKNLFKENTTLALSAGTLTGKLQLRASKTAGVANYGVYPMIAADARTGLAAQSGTPVFVVVTTAADGTVSFTQSAPITVDLAANTGTLKTPQTAVVNVPADGKSYVLEITATESGDDNPGQPHVVAKVPVAGTGAVTLTLPLLKSGTYSFNLVAVAATGGFTLGTDGALTAPLTVG